MTVNPFKGGTLFRVPEESIEKKIAFSR